MDPDASPVATAGFKAWLYRPYLDLGAIGPAERVDTLWLLHRICLHAAILRHARSPTDDEIRRSEPHAGVAYLRGLATMAFANDGVAELDTAELERVATLAPEGGWARIEATYSLSAAAAKLRHDPER